MAIQTVNRICWDEKSDKNSEALLSRGWLVTNGVGGYASGTISGAVTRRYHGLLIAALPNPLGRTVMLNHLSEKVYTKDGQVFDIGAEEKTLNELVIDTIHYLKGFKLVYGIPVWTYKLDKYVIKKKNRYAARSE